MRAVLFPLAEPVCRVSADLDAQAARLDSLVQVVKSRAVPKRPIETDYLVVGCGAAGMAFADSLIDASHADIVMVDRRHAPGGHWLEAYPFVRLHQPSLFYGVNSLPLGSETIDRHGPNEGFYERAGAAEICGYYDRIMPQRLLPAGRGAHPSPCS